MGQDEHIVGGSSEGSVLTGVNWLTRVNTRCVRKVEKTRVVGFRVPSPLVDAYSDLPDNAKTTIRVVVASLVYALAKKYGIDVECEEQLKPMLSEIPALGGSIVLNININNNENRNEVRLEIPQEFIRKLDDLLDLLSFLAFQADERVYPRSIKKRAESGYQTLRRLKKLIIDQN